MKSLNWFFFLVSAPVLLAANPVCIPTADLTESVITQEIAQPIEKSNVFPVEAIEGVGTTLKTFNALGVLILTPGVQSGQGIRSDNIMKVLGCNDGEDSVDEPLSVAQSPLRMELGNTPLRYHLGAVIGNWVVFSGTAVVSGVLAKRFGAESIKFPGVISIPALFLLPAVTESAVKLMAQGTSGETVAGICSALAQTAGVALMGTLMHPKFFHAVWGEDGWEDAPSHPGFVAQTDALYDGLREHRNWFMLVDTGMSTISGLLAGLQGATSNCGTLLAANAAVFSGYALALIVLKPFENKYEQYFFSGIAAAQAVALTAQAIAHSAASKDTVDEVRPVAQGIVAATELLLSIKTAIDIVQKIAQQATKIFNFYKSTPEPPTAKLQDLAEPLNMGAPEGSETDSILGIKIGTAKSSDSISIDLSVLKGPENAAKSSDSTSIDLSVLKGPKGEITPDEIAAFFEEHGRKPVPTQGPSAPSSESSTPGSSVPSSRSSTPIVDYQAIGIAHRSDKSLNPFEHGVRD